MAFQGQRLRGDTQQELLSMGEKLGRPALPSGVEGSRPYRPGLEGPETGLIVGHTTRQPATLSKGGSDKERVWLF